MIKKIVLIMLVFAGLLNGETYSEVMLRNEKQQYAMIMDLLDKFNQQCELNDKLIEMIKDCKYEILILKRESIKSRKFMDYNKIIVSTSIVNPGTYLWNISISTITAYNIKLKRKKYLGLF